MIYELREYKMVMHLQQDFLERFREDLVPGMEKLGFDFLGAWLTYIGPGSHTDLVWLLRWNDLGERDAAFDALHAQPGHPAYVLENGPRMTSVTVRFMHPTEFSPMK